MTTITRYSPKTMRFRHTMQLLNQFVQDALANTDSDVDVVFQDAYDKHLAGLNIDDDFPAIAVPAWMAFKTRYVSDVTGGLVTTADNEDVLDLVSEAISMAIEVRDLVESETATFEDRDRDAYFAADARVRGRF
jgi:hypothetical protein